MGLRINQNIAAQNAYRNLSVTDGQMSKSLEKLSSGFRINRAADDAAGLSISEGLRAQIGGLKVAVRNAQEGVSVVQTAEGALTEVHAILQRMRDLGVQANNTGSQNTEARTAAQTEFNQLSSELDRIGSTTSFGKSKLLDGTYGNTSASLSGAITGATSGVTVVAGTDDEFTITATGTSFQKSDGTFAAPSGDLTVTVAAGTYSSAGAYQKAVQDGLDAALTADGFSAGTMKANVTDNGGGVWKIELTSDKALTAANTGGEFIIATGANAIGMANGGTSTTTGTGGGTFQVGANNNSAEQIRISIAKVDASALGLGGVDLVNNASGAIDLLDTAIGQVSTQRATLGAYQNRFEHTINNLNVAVENLSASESRIRDTDMAQEMVSFTRAQILSQAGTSMLAQANQAPQSVLSLLR
ncbi:flagellin [Micromonospora pattaloongensis]|uniref:Flagellin n=1 Tax=Micromonospora pattaloongensis TaxID=405436 RepID=A0A1H3MWM5_9ACTN|nr:flagellin [Micromonospora pattaloongensis]SDY80874.1 flagellin [Micromonospora pattaloongensis]